MAVTQAQLTELYLAYFGRPPDFDGLNFYMAQPNATIASVAANFSASPESIALYGEGDASLSNLINAIYNNLFNRDAEPDGLTFWSNAINQGWITKAGAAYEILKGAQNEDKIAVANKIAVSTAFVAALDTTPEILGYSGDAANASAREFLQTVDSSEASLTAATTGLDAAVAEAVGLGGPQGVQFSLTTGKDVFVGNAGNDTIDAVPAVGTLGHISTLDAFDSIDGGGGKDTLNIYTGGGDGIFSTVTNTVQQGTVKNVEIINIFNAQATFGNEGVIDAAAFQGATEIWQHGSNDSDLVNVTAATTVGFAGYADHFNVDLQATAATSTLNIRFDDAGYGFSNEQGWIDAYGNSLGTVNITGNLAVGDESDEEEWNWVGLDLSVGDGVTTATVNSSVNLTLEVGENTGDAAFIDTVDASGSTGGIQFWGEDSDNNGHDIATIKTGSGEDYVQITTITAKDDVATGKNETVSASVTTAAGDDFIDVLTTGNGTTSVDAGDGDDDVEVYARGSGKLSVALGAGDDAFDSYTAVNGTDSIDGGAGSDTLLLNLVGASNVGAFSNFEVFDARNLGGSFDMDILASKNTVTEVISTGWVGLDATLLNLGAGVGYRATEGNVDVLTLTQKTAGALTVTLDVDQDPEDADGGDYTVVTRARATNATSLTAKFDSDFVDDVNSTIGLGGGRATTLTVESGGTNSDNTLNYGYGIIPNAASAPDGVLTTVTITGTEHLTLNLAGRATPDAEDTDTESNVATVNASASTGGLTFNLSDLKDKGSVTLGSGVDHLTVTAASTQAGIESIVGFEKGVTTAISDADTLVLVGGNAVVGVNDNAAFKISNGVVTFTGAGPQTLAEAIGLVDTAANDAGEVAAFQYINDTYVFVQVDGVGSEVPADVVVKLTGVAGVTSLAEIGTSDVFFLT